MALQSQLFHGDPKLEAAAVSDPAHITNGNVLGFITCPGGDRDSTHSADVCEGS
jgi:hypothetical protein